MSYTPYSCSTNDINSTIFLTQTVNLPADVIYVQEPAPVVPLLEQPDAEPEATEVVWEVIEVKPPPRYVFIPYVPPSKPVQPQACPSQEPIKVYNFCELPVLTKEEKKYGKFHLVAIKQYPYYAPYWTKKEPTKCISIEQLSIDMANTTNEMEKIGCIRTSDHTFNCPNNQGMHIKPRP